MEPRSPSSYKSDMSRCKSLPFVLVVGSVAVISACRDQSRPANIATTTSSSARPSPTPTPFEGPGESVVDCIKRIHVLYPGETSGLLKAWKRQPGYQNYRMVEASDFRIPDWVRRDQYWPDVERATGWSSDYGEMNGAWGVVLFMVQRTATFPKWFSVAVLIKRPGNRFDLYWIFQNADLTHFNLGRHSGDVYLLEYTDDGKTRSCDLEYSRQQGRWACEL